MTTHLQIHSLYHEPLLDYQREHLRIFTEIGELISQRTALYDAFYVQERLAFREQVTTCTTFEEYHALDQAFESKMKEAFSSLLEDCLAYTKRQDEQLVQAQQTLKAKIEDIDRIGKMV